MNVTKKLILLLILSSTVSLFGCATTYHRGEGIIIAERKLKDKDYKPHQAAETGALIGGGAGAATGAIAGGSIGFVVGALLSNNIPIAIASTVGGGAIGALLIGTAGGTVGGGIGYLVDINTKDAGLYEFTIQLNDSNKPYVVTQYTTPIPLETPVIILENNKGVFIKKK